MGIENALRRNIIKKKLPYLLSVILLIAVHVCIIYFASRDIDYMLNSDDASELILSKLLTQEKKLVTGSWYYSTELRVLNTQLIYAFFFLFTNDWHVVRVLSIATCHLLMTASVFFFADRAGLKKYAPVLAALMLCPMEIAFADYLYVVILKLYYIPHICITLLSLGLCLGYGKQASAKKRLVMLLVSGALAFTAGLGGMRQLVVTYLPLALGLVILSVGFIYKHGWGGYRSSVYSRYTAMGLADLFSCAGGYLVNSLVLHKYFSFYDYGEISFSAPDFDTAKEILADLFGSLGYCSGPISAKTLFTNALCGVICLLILYSLIYILKNAKTVGTDSLILVVFWLCGMGLFFLIYMFSTMGYVRRYYLPILIFALPLVAAALKTSDFGKFPRHTRSAVYVLLVGALLCRGAIAVSDLIKATVAGGPTEFMQIADFLLESGHTEGYATFWNGNVLTELTDGKVNMRVMGETDTRAFSQLFAWLQRKDNFESIPEGKVFVLLSNSEIDSYTWKDNLRDEDILFKTGGRTIYGYESYHDMMETLADYTYDMAGGDQWLIDGELVDGARVLHSGGVSFGPYIHIEKGIYEVTITGENVDMCTINAYDSSAGVSFAPAVEKRTDGKVVLFYEIDAGYDSAEICITNGSDGDVRITGISIDMVYSA